MTRIRFKGSPRSSAFRPKLAVSQLLTEHPSERL